VPAGTRKTRLGYVSAFYREMCLRKKTTFEVPGSGLCGSPHGPTAAAARARPASSSRCGTRRWSTC
ncbi:hypothetical protein, partial [Amycolatopsis kentuckyensis]|uniref:hypothetical protein n=1 Tax=Amycolatopsis kentuckyensis TaxID=218823 RepID=UPI001ABF2ACD